MCIYILIFLLTTVDKGDKHTLVHSSAEVTGVDKGAQGVQAPQWPGKKNIFVKIEGLSSFT